jgi:hypothetical protein
MDCDCIERGFSRADMSKLFLGDARGEIRSNRLSLENPRVGSCGLRLVKRDGVAVSGPVRWRIVFMRSNPFPSDVYSISSGKFGRSSTVF